MIVIDKDNKNLVIPNGLGNINRDYQEGYEAGYQESFDDGKAEGLAEGRAEGLVEGKAIGIEEGKQIQKDLLEAITITENGTYNKEDGYNQVVVDVPDLNGDYQTGYDEGYEAGEVEQKSKLTNITISENGTYTREDGYNEIVVDVPDTNGSYDEGYADGVENAGEIAAENAVILDATENKTYYTKYVDILESITGEFEDGTPFYSYAELNNISYDTGIRADSDTKIELWWCGNVTQFDRYIFYGDTYQGIFKVCVVNNDNLTNALYAEINDKGVNKQNLESNVWYHIELSKEEGFKINGELIGTFEGVGGNWNYKFYINTLVSGSTVDSYANGKFGMIKINDTIIIPTPDGFLNTNTNEILSTKNVSVGGKYFYKNRDFTPIDNLIKQVNVNVKIDVKESGIKFGYSTFTEVPDFYDFSNITDMSHMFQNCVVLTTIPLMNTSNATNMEDMFSGCSNLQTIPALDTSNVTNMTRMFQNCSNLQTIPLIDTSNATNIDNMFYGCSNLQTIPELDTSNVTTMYGMFYTYRGIQTLTSLPKFNVPKLTNINRLFYSSTVTLNNLTEVGGWENLNCNWNDNGGLVCLPNLTYQSCINILNGLADVTELGSRTLKVHQNFLDLVGDEISIGTNKNWTITA